jgi:DNA primase
MKPAIGTVLESYGWDGRATGYGSWRSTRCPIHQDRNPSARVNEDEGFFRCFVCEINGDAYDVVMIADGITFPDAKDKVKRLTGFDLDNPSNHGSRGGSRGPHDRAGVADVKRLTGSKLPKWAQAKHSRKLV